MFRKLVSNLPFNPSLIGQLSFYAKRMHQETYVRRLGILMVSLALFVQMFAVISPPEPTLARAGNDVIPGGAVGNTDQAKQGSLVNHCNANRYEFATILTHFQISCQDLSSGQVKSIRSTDYGNQLYSMGRVPYGRAGETSVVIPGAGTYYMRPLSSWDSGGYSTYKAIVGHSGATQQPFMILFNCGNLVIVGPPPAAKPPKQVTCSAIVSSVPSGSRVEIGTAVTVKGKSAAQYINPTDKADYGYQLINAQSGAEIDVQRSFGVPFGAYGLGEDPSPKTFTLTQSGHYQFRLFIAFEGKLASGSANGSCLSDIYVNTPPPPPEKNVVCTNLISSFGRGQKITIGEEVTVRGQATGQNVTNDDSVEMYYDYTDTTGKVVETEKSKSIKFKDTLAEDQVSKSFKMDKAGTYTFRLSVKFNDTIVTGSKTADCAKEIIVQEPCKEEDNDDGNKDTECLILSKTARNDTKDIDNADGTVASAGDRIVYTLSTKNTSKGTTINDYVVEENLIDILQYADIENLSDGKLDEFGIVRWPKVNINPGQTLSKQIIVKVKNPIPSTPISASDPGSFDMKLTNVYGNTVNVKLPPNIVKTTEIATTSLPNTGPGETMTIGFVVIVFAGYFFMRSRLLAKEADIIRQEYAISGGV